MILSGYIHPRQKLTFIIKKKICEVLKTNKKTINQYNIFIQKYNLMTRFKSNIGHGNLGQYSIFINFLTAIYIIGFVQHRNKIIDFTL